MKTYISVALIFLSISACTQIQAPLTQDQQLSRDIMGSWITAGDSSDYDPSPGRETFSQDGTYWLYMFSDASCTHVTHVGEAAWYIKDGILVSETKAESDSSMGPLGRVMRDQIVSLNKTKLVLHSLDDNTTYSRTRSMGCFADKQLNI
ncbi:MAG: hypothetical protein WBR29_11200 [Gammaproteobacteria bacterium]